MTIFFSPSFGAFYDTAVWPHDLPTDVVEVTKEAHADLLEQICAGKVIEVDVDGCPVAVDAPSPSVEELSAVARARRDREILDMRWLIERHQDELALGLTTTLTAEDVLLVRQHAQLLRDVPEQDGFPVTIEWPALAPELVATGG